MRGNNVGIPRRRLRTIELFAGAGGGILGSEILGHRTVAAVEIDPYCRRVLLERQYDGSLPDRFGVWDDVRTFDGRPWAGLDADGFPRCDVIKGGFPCTDISAANSKGAGIEGAKSGLWGEMARIIREVRPRFVFVENSPRLIRKGLVAVVGDFAEMGYDARWCVLGAHHVGSPHKRERIWVLATDADRDAVRNDEQRAARRRVDVQNGWNAVSSYDGAAGRLDGWPFRTGRPPEPVVGRVVSDGLAHRMDRHRAIGNGQHPNVAALAWIRLGGPT